MPEVSPRRARIAFRAVNLPGAPGYDPGLQRHHLLPRQLLSHRCFRPMLAAIGRERLHFEDFRANGLLLPACDQAALVLGLPLHRGPHRDYNALVSERVGQIERDWATNRGHAPDDALRDALARLELLQRALRRRLLDRRRRLMLNRRDPSRLAADFAEIDAMAAQLWGATEAG